MKKHDIMEKKKTSEDYSEMVANKKIKYLPPDKPKLPRGIKNNNPLNIRIGNNWLGEKMPNTDGAFEQFESMPYGIRAALKIIFNYMNKYKKDTIRKIISRWAPRSENKTNEYIDYVSKRMNIGPDDQLYFEFSEMRDLVLAIIGVR